MELNGLVDPEREAIGVTTSPENAAWLSAANDALGGAGELMLLQQHPKRLALIFRGRTLLESLLPLLSPQLRDPLLREKLTELTAKLQREFTAAVAEPSEGWRRGLLAIGLSLPELPDAAQPNRRTYRIQVGTSSLEAAAALKQSLGKGSASRRKASGTAFFYQLNH